MKFQHYILYIQQFKVLGNFDKATFPSIAPKVPKKKQKKKKKKKKKKNACMELNENYLVYCYFHLPLIKGL